MGKKQKEKIKTQGLTAEKDEFSEWFTQIMLKADLADYTDISGCLVFRPTAYAIWETIKQDLDQNCQYAEFEPAHGAK